MKLQGIVKKIEITGHRSERRIACPYCPSLQKITLISHLRQRHPAKWELWLDEFVRLYNETNDLKSVMRAFSNADGRPVLSWSVIDSEIKRRTSKSGLAPLFNGKGHIDRWDPSHDEYHLFNTTVWDIPFRGSWGVHQATYRGNWAPQVPRALIESYSVPGDTVLDPFAGGGTTLIEAWSLGRNAVGYDVSDTAIEMTRARLGEMLEKGSRDSIFGLPPVRIEVRKGDARLLHGVPPDSIDLICAHPPYGAAIRYTYDDPDDLSALAEPMAFLAELGKTIARCFCVVKPGGVCAILVGDIRHRSAVYPLGLEVLAMSRTIGFELHDIIIKTQNQDRSTEFYYRDPAIKFRLSHEYLLVLKKPANLYAGSKQG